MIVDWQYEPIEVALLHIDLKRIAMDKKLTVSVPIVQGEADIKQRAVFLARPRGGNRVLAGGYSQFD